VEVGGTVEPLVVLREGMSHRAHAAYQLRDQRAPDVRV
jgi:hypothetical protein